MGSFVPISSAFVHIISHCTLSSQIVQTQKRKIMEPARACFAAFAQYGGSSSDGSTIDNKKFSKMCKETKIMNKSCTSTDVDIVFAKVKSKGARVINFDQCCEALKELAKKRFKGDDNGLEKCFDLMAGKTPGNVGTTKTSKTGNVSKMTDTSQYTGAHKERFGADGKGKGLAGRENLTENTGYVGNYKGADTYDKTH